MTQIKGEIMLTNGMKKFKIIKIIIVSVFIVLATLQESKLFYNHLMSFHSTDFWYNSFICTDEELRQSMMDELYQCAKEEGVLVFAVAHTNNNSAVKTITVLGDDEIKPIIQKKCQIKEKSYRMPEDGTVRVSFYPFAEINHYQYRNSNVISYIGNKEKIDRLYQRIGKKYGFTALARLESHEWQMLVLSWIAVFGVLTAITVIEVARNKKRIAYKIESGTKRTDFIKAFIFWDVVADIAAFILIRTALFVFYYGQFFKPAILLGYSGMVLFSCLLYLYFGFYNWEKVLANRREEKDITIRVVVILVFLYFSIHQILVNRLDRQFTQPLSHRGEKAMLGGLFGSSWFYETTENYVIASMHITILSQEVYGRIQRTDAPSETKIALFEFSVNSNNLFGDYLYMVDYQFEDCKEGGRIIMDGNGNYITIDATETEITENIKKFIQDHPEYMNSTIDIANQWWKLEIPKQYDDIVTEVEK